MSNLNAINIGSIEQIVIPKYNASYTTVLCLKELANALKDKVDKAVEIVKDNLEEKTVEILVGQTNRSDILGRRLPEDYIIEIKNGKIIVDGGSVKALNFAINLLIEKVNSGEFEVETIDGQCSDECDKAAEYFEKITDDFNDKELDKNIWRIWNTEPPFGPEIYRNKEDATSPTIYLKRLEENNVLCNGSLNQIVTVGEKTEKDGAIDQIIYGAKIETSRAFCFRYGYVEFSAKAASGDSMGGAVWLHGDNSKIGNHYCEFDIAEFYGSPCFHRTSPLAWKVVQDENGNRRNQSGWYLALKEGEVAVQKHCFHLENKESFANCFHTYGLEWDENYYRFTLDGDIIMEVKYTDVTKDVAEKYGYTQEEMIHCYQQPAYGIISIEAGKYGWGVPGFWNNVGASAEDIANVSNLNTVNWKDDNVFSIDYFTVYQKEGQLNGKTIAEVNAQIDQEQ